MITWTRAELKERAKESLRLNYWKMVLVALVFGIVAGNSTIEDRNSISDYKESYETITNPGDIVSALDGSGSVVSGVVQSAVEEFVPYGAYFTNSAFRGMFASTVVFGIIIAIAISLAISFGLVFPLYVSCCRFFVLNKRDNGEASPAEMAYVWKSGQMWNVGKGMFIKDVVIFLWSLLLVVPGIVKAYSYRLVPYILADNPDMEWGLAMEQSRKLMDGHRWDAFVLDLSFIGWHILSALTLGILGIFYVAPYSCQTNANLYSRLNGEDVTPDYSNWN